MKIIYGVKYLYYPAIIEFFQSRFFFYARKTVCYIFNVHNVLVRNICKSSFNSVVPYAKVTLIYCNASDWS